MGLRVLQYKKDDAIFHSGDSAKSMYLVKSGCIKAFKRDTQGRESEAFQIDTGGIIGDLSFFTQENRNITARASTDLELIEISYDTLNQDFEELKPWFKIMLKKFANQIKTLNQEIEELRVTSPKAQDKTIFADRTLLKLTELIILTLATEGVRTESGTRISMTSLYSAGAQIFSLPNNKIRSFILALCKTSYIYAELGNNVEEIIHVTIEKPDLFHGFAKFLLNCITNKKNNMLNPTAEESALLRAMADLSLTQSPNHKGQVSIQFGDIISKAKTIESKTSPETLDRISLKGIQFKKESGDGEVTLIAQREDLVEIAPYWEILHVTKSTGFLAE